MEPHATREFEQIEQRAKEGADGEALERDLEDWAQRHGAELVTREHSRQEPEPERGGFGCEPVMKEGNFWCVLIRSYRGPDGFPVCVYRCTTNLPGRL